MRDARLAQEDSFGPFFSRFLGSHLWRGETFFMQIDAHSDFREVPEPHHDFLPPGSHYKSIASPETNLPIYRSLRVGSGCLTLIACACRGGTRFWCVTRGAHVTYALIHNLVTHEGVHVIHDREQCT